VSEDGGTGEEGEKEKKDPSDFPVEGVPGIRYSIGEKGERRVL